MSSHCLRGKWSLLASFLPPSTRLSWQPQWGAGGWTAQLLAGLPSMLRFHPVFSLAALRADRGWGPPCPVISPLRVHTPGPPPPVPSFQGGRLSRTALKTGTFKKMGLTENDMGALSGAPWS